ncbi:oligopeptidase A [Rubrivivax gelatinosus]|uniref:M3 family metallopeptidase n=2 Tax=Rubrivivax gelatinosus TaxID=28068 RepID=UPI0018CAF39B|nr:M3 family metallopeptidase [Rubrivivax gelatinosus]MBG6082233.1 oligopeptidase A [Rubrivivax gelatinosus]
MNPLLDFSGLPRFAEIRAEHVVPAVDALLAEADAALEAAVSDAVPADYEALSRALDVPVERLRRAWGAVGHLQAVADTPELRAAYGEALPRVTDFLTRLGADERLYAKYKAVAAQPAAALLAPARRKALADALRDFVLGGAELQGAARERFAAIQARLAELSQSFGEHVLDATDGFALYVDTAALAGVPADVVEATRAAAAAEGREGHKLTLHEPVLRPVLQYAHDRGLREQLFRADATRASEFGAAELDNGPLIAELVALRQEEATLLGLASHAELSLVPKMAETPAQVMDFIRDLARRARPFAQADKQELEDCATRELGLSTLEPWDRRYASERLKQSRYAFSNAEVRQYFTEPRVLDGLFGLVRTLFEVEIVAAEAPVWHPDVRFCELRRDGRTIAGVYLDLHARPGKQSGAWMDDARGRWARPDGGGLQWPLAHLVCNFAPPVGDKPALLSHDDVVTLFHEFGHGLHHMLTQVDELAVAGISGVEWDAVELPSQFMENFAWEWEVLSRLSAHVDTGEPLPRELFERMVAAKNFQSGLMMLRHAEFGLFDMRLHAEPGNEGRVMALAEEVRAEIGGWAMPEWHRFPHSFTHLFDGGYSAGYYSYAWAEVLSADAFSAFEEAGVFDAATGRRFRECILEAGGSRPALASFVAFRGREPRLDALLRHQGMDAPEASVLR